MPTPNGRYRSNRGRVYTLQSLTKEPRRLTGMVQGWVAAGAAAGQLTSSSPAHTTNKQANERVAGRQNQQSSISASGHARGRKTASERGRNPQPPAGLRGTRGTARANETHRNTEWLAHRCRIGRRGTPRCASARPCRTTRCTRRTRPSRTSTRRPVCVGQNTREIKSQISARMLCIGREISAIGGMGLTRSAAASSRKQESKARKLAEGSDLENNMAQAINLESKGLRRCCRKTGRVRTWSRSCSRQSRRHNEESDGQRKCE